MRVEITPAEASVIQHLRALKQNKGTGTLRVEVTAGAESLLKREHSVKDLTMPHPSVTIHP